MSDNTDSTSPAEEKLKQCGRAPAEKIAGGVRIARKEKRASETSTPETKDEEVDEQNETMIAKPSSNNILASTDLAAQTKKDYPEAAVRASHDKPLPCHQKPVDNQPKPRQNNQVFQPQRFNN